MTEEFDIYVPGHSQCPKCQFYLVRTLINPALAIVGADTSTTPNCPNDGTEMRSITWRELAISQATANTVLYNKILELTEQLKAFKNEGDTDGG